MPNHKISDGFISISSKKKLTYETFIKYYTITYMTILFLVLVILLINLIVNGK